MAGWSPYVPASSQSDEVGRGIGDTLRRDMGGLLLSVLLVTDRAAYIFNPSTHRGRGQPGVTPQANQGYMVGPYLKKVISILIEQNKRFQLGGGGARL